MVEVLVEEGAQVGFEGGQVVGGEAFAGTDGEAECEVAYPASAGDLDAADLLYADHGVAAGE
ncbi:hypothetical protein [Streptomyces chartreusis]|uniref:hypothetical protein n=1 Tax=Streptomyces chartreusis TaxID=1969 RepID=UPI003829E876